MGENMDIQECYDYWEKESYLATLLSGIALVVMLFSLLACTGDGFFAQCVCVFGLGVAPLLVLISFMAISLAKEANTFIALNESHRESSADIKKNIRYSIIVNIVAIVLFLVGMIALYERFPV